MKSVNSQKGIGNRTILIIIAAIAFIFFLVIRIGPVLYNQKALESNLNDFVKVEGFRMTQDELIQAVIKIGEDSGVALTPEQITVTYGPEENHTSVSVHYFASADLTITTYNREITITVDSFGQPTENRVRRDTSFSSPEPSSAPQQPSGPQPNPAGPYPDRAREAGKKISNQDIPDGD